MIAKKRFLLIVILLVIILGILNTFIVFAACDNDNICSGGENCQNCPQDCPIPDSNACCDPIIFHSQHPDYSERGINTVGVLPHGEWHTNDNVNYYVCCDGTLREGHCCPNDLTPNCKTGMECVNYHCVASSSQDSTPSTYCGDGSCNDAETCSSCPDDCGSCQVTKKSNGYSCSSNSDCRSGNCNNGMCCEYGKDCCISSSIDCNPGYSCVNYYCQQVQQQTAKKSIGQPCSSSSECLEGECDKGICNCIDCNGDLQCDVPQIPCMYCGDGSCNNAETCSSCFKDCGSCDEGIYTDGDSCAYDSDCQSGNCNLNGVAPFNGKEDGICCKAGKNCCRAEFHCTVGFSCSRDFYYCSIPGTIVSVMPENDVEGIEIKRMIEEEIYPILINIFDENSDDFFTGMRKFDISISLVMTSNPGEASWDEKTNTLTVPYASIYKDMGNYNAKTMQINALAHELAHYHFDGSVGGDYNNVPLWFREGLAEYGASAYYKKSLSGKDNNPIDSVSEYRESRFGSYLEDKEHNYKETWKENGIKKVSWNKISDMNTNLEGYDHIYYGATFSFIKYLLSKDTYKEGESMMDVLKYMFAAGADGKFAFYAHVLNKDDTISEQDLKTDWIETFEKSYDVDKLENEPKGILYKIHKFWNYIFRLD